MKAMLRTMVFAAAVWLPVAGASAADGVLIVLKVTRGGGTPQTNQIQIDQRRMRAEVTGADGGHASVMFDGAHQVMTIVNDAEKSYSELTKADLDAFAAQMSGAMAQVEQMMKGMSPEQRKQMEALTKGKMGGAGAPGGAPAKPEYKKVGTATVGKWTCDKYDGYTNGQKTNEVCTVDPKALGFTAADFQVTRDMAEFFKAFQQLMPAGARQEQSFVLGTPESQGFSGIPVRSMHMTGGTQIVSELADVQRQAFTAATFQVPAGYQKNDLFGGRGRRGR
jgi:hypothetical protein